MEKNFFIVVIAGLLVLGIVTVIALIQGTAGEPDKTALLTGALSLGDAANLKVEELTPGTGAELQKGSKVTVHYTGTLTDGAKFDSSYDRNLPFDFTLGEGSVIPCWDQGLLGKKVGAKIKLTCPPALAYGAAGVGSAIPPNATLNFEIEILQSEP